MRNLTLSQKGLLLVSIPLVFQIIFVASIATLHSQAEREAARADHSKKISVATNEIVRDIFDIMSVTKGDEIAKSAFGTETYRSSIKNIQNEMSMLKELVKDEPENLQIVNSSAMAADRSLFLLNSCEAAYRSGNSFELMDALRKTRKELRYCIKGIVSNELLEMAKQNRAIEDAAPEKLAGFRNTVSLILFGAVGVNVVATVALAIFFSRYIVGRLNVLQDNSFRLASRQPLRDRLTGDDEIAAVDLTFHTMAEALQEAARKQTAMIENAADVICSIDTRGVFVSVSPAALRVFGFPPTELVGSKLVKLFESGSTDEVLPLFQKACAGETVPPIESRIKRSDGQLIDVLWSVHWSKTEGTLFCVAHDFTDRKTAERMKQEVVAMVSHDLRTPLATVRGFLEMLESGMFGSLSERGQKLLNVADRNAARMLTLVKDLLDIEKMEAGMLELHKSNVKFSTVFENCVQGVSTLATEKSVKLDLPATALEAFADEDRLIQVCTNLLTNAIKFSAPGGTVKLQAVSSGEFIDVSIIDNGRGIPRESISTVFDPFKQVEVADAKEKGGTGLGLAICKALVELHGGSIRVESEPGSGATFTFSIPRDGSTSAPDRFSPLSSVRR